ncbi:acyltransferase family protein [Intestinibacter sp.]
MNELDKESISFLRVFATILILCCHLVVTFDNHLLQLSSQFFNVGVYLFIAISGYLYGKKDISKKGSYKNWILSRGKRILGPMYIFMIFLFFIYLALGLEIKPFNWIIYIFNLQGLEIYVHGAEHLWYLTIAMVCYFITPLLEYLRPKYQKKNIVIFSIIYIIVQILMSYYIYQQFGRYLIIIGLYILTYLIGYFWNSSKVTFKTFILGVLAVIISLFIRVLGMLIFDGSILYDILIVGYSHSMLGLGLFFIGFFISNKLKKNHMGVIKYFDGISYEIYLVHYMFIGGPVSVLFTKHSLINCLIVLIFTYMAALILNNTCKFILN